jgi:hypothetical protein
VEEHLKQRASEPGKDETEVQKQIKSLRLNPPDNCGACHY